MLNSPIRPHAQGLPVSTAGSGATGSFLPESRPKKLLLEELLDMLDGLIRFVDGFL